MGREQRPAGEWENFWKDPNAKSYYFIGKDNIPFHSIIWPAILLGYGNGLNLPYDVPANEFLSLENQKFSTSQNWAVWLPDYLEKYDPDPLRYLLSINMPESGDSDFSWSEFVRRNNEELVATYGNLVNRVLSFTYRNFDGKVPGVKSLDEGDEGLLRTARETMDSVDQSIYNCRFKAAITQAFSLAQEANRYLDAKAPWKTIKEDRDLAGASLTVAMQAINCLRSSSTPSCPSVLRRSTSSWALTAPLQRASGTSIPSCTESRPAPPCGSPRRCILSWPRKSSRKRSRNWVTGPPANRMLHGLDQRTASIYAPVQEGTGAG